MARIIKIIITCYFICFSIYATINLNSINEKLNNTNIDYKLDIKEKEYYNSHLLNNINEINDLNEYILYFHQDNCEYCLKTNVLMDKLITSTNTNIYLLTPERYKDIFDEKQIESTPTLIYIKNNIEKKYVGLLEVEEFIKDYLNK